MIKVVMSLFVISFSIISTLTSATQNNPFVTVPLGRIIGYFSKTRNGATYAAFEGIPYGEPPIGAKRFKEPIPITIPWHGTWHANTIYKCMQYNHYTEPGQDYIIGDEDCLYLNIYTPLNVNESSNLDVIVFIHGGAFMFNYGGSYGPKIIMDRNVIFVNFNYRLGPLGFLSTEDENLPGNNGIRDQILALKWIKDNIKYFGGNPESITLTGMSAGGASVHLHFLSPLSKGLFNRGMSQSGTMLNPWVLMENGREKAFKLADLVGCPTKVTKETINCLQTRPGRQIVETVKSFLPWLYNPFSPFGIVVDNVVLPDHPYVLLKKGMVQDYPYLFSNVDSEGMYPAADFIADDNYLRQIDSDWNRLMPFILDYNNTVSPKDKDNVSQKIREFYMKNEPVNRETFLDFVKIITDRLFVADIQKSARFQSAAMKSQVYYYYFSYRGAHSKSEQRSRSNINFGASHGDDTVYVLSANVDVQIAKKDKEMSEKLTNMWLSFASNNYPTFSNIGKWPTVSKNYEDPLEYIEIKSTDEVELLSNNNLGNHEFWSKLHLKENENLFLNTHEEL